MQLKANLTLLFVALVWGSGFLAQNVAAEHQIVFLFNGVCFLMGGLVLIPFMPRKRKVSREQWKWMLIASTILFFASTLQQIGILYTKIANASFLTSLYIVFIPFILWFAFREKTHWVDALAVLVAVFGAYLLSTGGQGVSIQLGDGLEILGAVFWGMHVVVVGKFASKFEPISFASGHFIMIGIVNLLIGLMLEDASQLLLPDLLFATFYRGLFSVGIGYTLQVWSQNHTAPTATGLILASEAVFASIFARTLLGQSLTPLQMTGCVLILVAVIFSQFKGER
jgi:drug/metabolite transporter (DMT)-like permease